MTTTTTQITPLAKHLRAREAAAQLHLVGLDAGNSTALIADGENIVQIPSYVGTGTLSDLLTARGGAGAGQALGPGEYAITLAGQTWYVGELALAQTRDAATARGDTARYTNGHTLRLLLALAGALYDSDVRLRIVTGVPPAVLREQPQIKSQVAEALVGTHHYTMHDQRGSREMVVVVEAVAVVSEAVATLAALGEPGKPIGIVDIGGHTVDVSWFDKSGRVVEARTDSLSNGGVERIGQQVSLQFRQQHGRALQPVEVDEVLRAYLAGEDATVYHRGPQRIGHEEMVTAVQSTAAIINTFLAQRWALAGGDGTVAADGAYVLVVGGGARFLSQQLHIDTQVRVPEQPEQANARSYYLLALRIDARASWPKQGQ